MCIIIQQSPWSCIPPADVCYLILLLQNKEYLKLTSLKGIVYLFSLVELQY